MDDVEELFRDLSSMHDKDLSPDGSVDLQRLYNRPSVLCATTYHAHGRNVLVSYLSNGEVWQMVTGGVDPQWTRLPPIPGTV